MHSAQYLGIDYTVIQKHKYFSGGIKRMAVDTVKRNKRQYEWIKQNTERINCLLEKGMKEKIEEAATAAGISKSDWIRQAIEEKLKK